MTTFLWLIEAHITLLQFLLKFVLDIDIYYILYMYVYRKTLFNLYEQLLYFIFAQNISRILSVTLMTL